MSAVCIIPNCRKHTPAGEPFCADHRDTHEEIAHGRTIDQRDTAEEAVSQAYYLVTGRSPEWSSVFGYSQALEEIEDACASLRLAVRRFQPGPTPVAWRVKDFADGWIYYSDDEAHARKVAADMGGALVEPLYSANPAEVAK